MHPITDYHVYDHGVNDPQYFRGHGIALTGYTDCATGCGDTYNEAFEDACNQLAERGWDTESIINGDKDNPLASRTVRECLHLSDDDMEHCEAMYYVSIDVH